MLERHVPLRCFLDANSSKDKQIELSQFLSGLTGSLTRLSRWESEEAAIVCENNRKLLCRTRFLVAGEKSGQP